VGGGGNTGPTGPNGVGVPTGGSAGYVLTKVNGTNYNTIWSAPSGGSAKWGLLKVPSAATNFSFGTAVYSGTSDFTFTATGTPNDLTTFTLGLANPSLPLIFTNAYCYSSTAGYINVQRQFGPNSGTSSATLVVNSSFTALTFTNMNKTNFPYTANDNAGNGYCLYLYIYLLS
jgi:hypothetical protein